MKKYISVFLSVAMILACLSACSGKSPSHSLMLPSDSLSEGKPLRIVVTIFPGYDWVKEILGGYAGRAEIAMLLDSGVDLHNYQPTAEDMMKIADCDLFLYVGGESDAWVEDALQANANQDRVALNLLEVLGDGAKEEEFVEGMEGGEQGEGEEEAEYDEHVWFSLKNAGIFCDAIADALARIDPDYADEYRTNAESYKKKLSDLDARYQSAAEDAAQKTLLFGDRFPFRYLADDYGLAYYAAFAGCSAETEASFETVTFLAGKVDALCLKTVMALEKSDQKIARTIIQNTRDKNQQILVMDSMQSIVAGDVADGVTYLSIMESNLDILRKALR